MNGPGFSSDETGAQSLGVPVAEAQVILREHIAGMMKRVLDWHRLDPQTRPDPLHIAMKVTTGVGKSEELRQQIVPLIKAAKRLGLPHRVLIAVPTHKLADEARTKMPDGVTSAIWQGRDSNKLGTAERMCLNLDAVNAALAVGAEVEETACRRGGRGRPLVLCPFHGTCRYQAQKVTAKAADVVFMAHEGLFRLPDGIGRRFALVIVDEGFWQKGLTGIRDDKQTRLAIAGLAEELEQFPVHAWIPKYGETPRIVRGKRKMNFERVVDHDRTQELRHLLIEPLQRALAMMPDGYVRRAPLIKAGLWPRHDAIHIGACGKARKLEWARKVDHGIRPGATPEQLKAAVKKFGFLAQLPRRVEIWGALGDLINGKEAATGRLWIETVTTAEGSVRYLHIRGRKEIDREIVGRHPDFAGVPSIHADATLQLELSRHYLPRLQLELDLVVAAPHRRITQVIGLPVGKSSLQALSEGKRTPAEEARVAGKRQRLVDAARRVTRGRSGLVITYKDIEHEFDGVETGHFGAVEGIDRWGNVEVEVIIGRPLPRREDVERMAAAISGKPVIAVSVRQERPVCDVTLKVWTYTTPEAEQVRAGVTEAAIEQAEGRTRAVRRTAANPVETFLILSDLLVPGLPVDAVVDFDELEPGVIDLMLDRGLVPQMPVDAARLHDDLFKSAGSAKKAYQRAGFAPGRNSAEVPPEIQWGTSPYRTISIRECPPLDLRVARYRPRGARRGARLVWFDPVKVPDLRAVLERALGELVLFEVLPEPEPVLPVALAHPDRRLPSWRIRRLAEVYVEDAAEQLEATGDVDHEVLEDRARACLSAEGFAAAVIEEVLGRVLHYVFAVPGRPPLDDWIMVEPGAPPRWAAVRVGLGA